LSALKLLWDALQKAKPYEADDVRGCLKNHPFSIMIDYTIQRDVIISAYFPLGLKIMIIYQAIGDILLFSISQILGSTWRNKVLPVYS